MLDRKRREQADGKGGDGEMVSAIPRFEPHPLLRNGHWQTIIGRYLSAPSAWPNSRDRDVALDDGDALRVVDSVPEGWRPGDPAVVLVHGLAGSAASPYVIRVANTLLGRGVRAVRMNLRGAGDGFGLARKVYHAGRTGDLRAVVATLASEAEGSPIGLVGFSLGGSLTLKLAAEAAERPVPGLDCILAANAPLDLSGCCQHMRRRDRRIYDRNFVRLLRKEVQRLHSRFPELGPVGLDHVRTVYDFDDSYTAPRNGFLNAEDYYTQSSAGPVLDRILLPGLVIHAEDDPFIPPESYQGLRFPPQLAFELIPSGGHLGYISRTRWEGNHRWLDTRLASWLTDRWRAHLLNRLGGLIPNDCHETQ